MNKKEIFYNCCIVLAGILSVFMTVTIYSIFFYIIVALHIYLGVIEFLDVFKLIIFSIGCAGLGMFIGLKIYYYFCHVLEKNFWRRK